jgi:hypothetical protein
MPRLPNYVVTIYLILVGASADEPARLELDDAP